MSNTELEKRVKTLEAELAKLKSKVEALDSTTPWWERIAGTFEDDDAYKEAMKLGSKYRRSLKPSAAARTRKS